MLFFEEIYIPLYADNSHKNGGLYGLGAICMHLFLLTHYEPLLPTYDER